jgi:hypothetical protein
VNVAVSEEIILAKGNHLPFAGDSEGGVLRDSGIATVPSDKNRRRIAEVDLIMKTIKKS